MDTLHIFSQQIWHDEAYIAGNRAGMTKLRDALTRALESEDGVDAFDSFVNDGEGFTTGIVVIEDTDRLAVPYRDEIAIERRTGEEVVWPWQIKRLRKALGRNDEKTNR